MATKRAKKKTEAKETIGKISMEKDLRVYAERIQPPVAGLKRCLGLDLGTNCGATFADFQPGTAVKDVPLYMGQWDLSVGAHDSGLIRFVRLKQFLSVLKPDLVVYEDVKFVGDNAGFVGKNYTAIVARVAKPAEFLGALKAVLGIWCVENNVPSHGMGIGQIKKFATGKGNANKVEMIQAANEQFGTDFDPETYESTGVDNICDAAFCCKMGIESYSEGLT